MTVRYTEAQALSLGLVPAPKHRRGVKLTTADGHLIDPVWLGMNEEGKDGFRAEVMKLVRRYGWSCGYGDEGELPGLAYHAASAMHQAEKGWPDLTLVRRRDRRIIFAELKRENGELSPRQAAVLGLLRCLETGPLAGVDHFAGPSLRVFVWRPSQLDELAAVLR